MEHRSTKQKKISKNSHNEGKSKRQIFSKLAASRENQQCGFRTGLTQTGLYSYRRQLEA